MPHPGCIIRARRRRSCPASLEVSEVSPSAPSCKRFRFLVVVGVPITDYLERVVHVTGVSACGVLYVGRESTEEGEKIVFNSKGGRLYNTRAYI